MTQTDNAGDFVRILRVSYTKPMELSEDVDRNACLPPLPPIYLYSQMFLLKSRNYADLKRAISDWYNSEIERKDNNNVDSGSGGSGSGSGSVDINDSIAVAEPSTSKYETYSSTYHSNIFDYLQIQVSAIVVRNTVRIRQKPVGLWGEFQF